MGNKVIRVLVVDDSALVRNILTKGLAMDPDIEVVASAADPYIARDKIVKLKPDVLTLDVEMPRMDGLEFLKRLMPQYPLPVVMVSALTQKGKQITMNSLEAGAVDFVTKPSTDVARGLNVMLTELRTKVKIASTVNVSHWKNSKKSALKKSVLSGSRALAESTDKVVAIGSSTGGTVAVNTILSQLPAVTPGVVIVQHMPTGFTKLFAERLNAVCQMEVKEAVSGDRVMSGRVLIAPGDYHVEVKRSGGIYQVICNQDDKVCGHRPSADKLMYSVSKNVGSNAVGVILTGMGNDGANGLLSMRKAGARTIAQDKESSVVFGMPNEANLLGGVEKMEHVDNIASRILSFISS